MAIPQTIGAQLKDRPEYKNMPTPLSMTEDTTVSEAVKAMCDRNYGCVVITGKNDEVTGIVTERDLMRKLLNQGKDPNNTKVSEIMSSKPRVAHESDNVVDWMRIMSNERFRRLPVVDENSKLKAVFTQGDFVSYSWPDLLHQITEGTKANVSKNYPLWMLVGGIMLYSLAMVILVSAI